MSFSAVQPLFRIGNPEGIPTLGERMLGADLYAMKQPTLGVIDPQTVIEAASLRADALMSINVAIHVSPEETCCHVAGRVLPTAPAPARERLALDLSPTSRDRDRHN